jgi:hypothetical protein
MLGFLGTFAFARAAGGSAILSWNANSESDLAGYKVYWDTTSHSGNCPAGFGANVIDVGNVTTYTFNNLTEGQTYYFQVTAYDSSNNESACSSEGSKLITASSGFGISDLVVMVSSWLHAGTITPDLDTNKVVNVKDFGIMMSKWN